MFMRDGLRLTGNGAAVFADELLGAVDSGMGNIKHIFGSKHCLNQKPMGGTKTCLNQDKMPLAHTNQQQDVLNAFLFLDLNACGKVQGAW